MNRFKHAVVVILTVIVACATFGCESTGAKKSSASSVGPLPAIEVDYGPGILHRYSDTLYPRDAAGFSLVDHKVYDSAGRDFSAVYLLKESSGRIGVIAHVFPTGVEPSDAAAPLGPNRLRDLVQKELDRSKSQLRRSRPEVVLMDEGALTLPIAGGERTVYRVLYKHQDSPPVLSQIYVTLLDEQWYLKYRVTSWGHEPAETYKRIGPLLSNLPLVKAEPAAE